MKKVRWLIDIQGQTEGRPDGVHRGLVMDLPDERANKYLSNGYVSTILDGPIPAPFMVRTLMRPDERDNRVTGKSSYY